MPGLEETFEGGECIVWRNRSATSCETGLQATAGGSSWQELVDLAR